MRLLGHPLFAFPSPLSSWLGALAAVATLNACDTPSTPAAAETGASAAAATVPTASAAPTAPASPSSDAAIAGSITTMPPRPVPKTQPTVGSGMPAEVQMQAIAYMVAMGQPKPDDPPADPAYAEQIATQLRPIAMAMDKGSPADKTKLNRVEVVAGGRRLDLLVAQGCDAQAPGRAVAQRAGIPLSTLRAHGVLVVRCNDARTQCLQSTRDETDILCTTAPRHK